MTHFLIVAVLRFPPKIVTTIRILAAVPRVGSQAGGLMLVTTPISMVFIIMASILIPGEV